MPESLFGPFADEAQYQDYKNSRERRPPPVRVKKEVQGGQIFAREVPIAASAQGGVSPAAIAGAALGGAAGAMAGPAGAAAGAALGTVVGVAAQAALHSAVEKAAALTDHDLDILTRTLWGEARGEPEAGQIAVVHVIRNRVISRRTDAATECQRPAQFSCWFDAQAPKLRALSPADGVYLRLAETARRAWNLPDSVGGALHYYAPNGMPNGKPPPWAAQGQVTTRIGAHVFIAGVPW